MTKRAPLPAPSPVAEYKQILKAVLDNRPSGTRQRLAEALDKNRSFISQIAGPAYPIPIPAQHLQTIFQVCHFSAIERQAFEDAYALAHPARLTIVGEKRPSRTLSITAPDFGSAKRNQDFDDLVEQFVKKVSNFAAQADDLT